MRSFFLAVFVTMIGGSAMAQTYFTPKIELGINGGMSTSTVPARTEFRGNKSSWNPTGFINVNYNFSDYWQLCFNAGATQFVTTGSQKLTGSYGAPIAEVPVTYVFASPAITTMLQFNRVVPFYSNYRDLNTNNFYFGVAAGAMFTVNDGGDVSNKLIVPTTGQETGLENVNYTREYHYAPGTGYVFGVQVGYTHYFGQAIGINVEVAPRYAYVKTVDPRYGRANDQYGLFYVPMTIGIRYRF